MHPRRALPLLARKLPLFGEGMIGEAITYPMSGIIAVQFEVTIPA